VLEQTILNFVSHFGYLGLFGILMFGIIGVPVPDEILLAFIGYLVVQGKLNYLLSIVTGALGSFTGMSLSYFLGERFGMPLLKKYGRYIHITPERIERVDQWFLRFGKAVVIVGYFIPGLRHLTAFTAGISKWRYGTFALYAAPGAVLWVFTFITLGRFLGAHWRVYTKSLHHYTLLAVFAIIVGFIIWKLAQRVKIKPRMKAK
jgi:membrane protein DedA with SNARE-associated domain